MVKNIRKYTVYKHTSPSGKVYIGITSKKPEERWKKDGSGYKTQAFWRAIQKYGWDNIQHEIIAEKLTKEEAEQMEIKLISEYRSNQREFGYNVANGGNCVGTISEETKRKIREAHIKPVVCDGVFFESIRKCAEYYKVNPKTMCCWLCGNTRMPKKFIDLGLRYFDESTNEKIIPQIGMKKGAEHYKSKIVICDNIEFSCVEECANFYNVKTGTMKSWLSGKHNMPERFFKMGLRYKGENIKQREKHDNKRKIIFCENMFFNSISKCAKYYKEVPTSMGRWLNGERQMPQKYIEIGLRYATQEEIENYKNIK